jgi:formylglycine-generating enzyme required for sulfatase activity
MEGSTAPEPVKVFFSYAHEDRDLRDKLEEHLSVLKHEGLIVTWHDRDIGAGREWAGRVGAELESADIILLLISSSFLASAYCYDKEMHRALQRHEEGVAVVIPVILRAADWEGAPFGKLQALPREGRPVTKWRNRDEAFTDIANEIAKVATRLSRAKAAGGAATPTSAGESRPSEGATTSKGAGEISRALQQMKFVLIKPGTFLMGSERGQADERPVREMGIAKPFYIGAYVVTQGEWRAVMGTEPWRGMKFVEYDDRYPAVYISWDDTKAFIAKANNADNENYYRLPTEAEWEYAARAGTTTDFSFGDDEGALNAYGWYKENASKAGVEHALPVGLKRPNPWGLYDVHGNVWEWVQDWYGPYSEDDQAPPTEKVLRGGGYDFDATGARSGFRNKYLPTRSTHVMGFRLVKEPI